MTTGDFEFVEACGPRCAADTPRKLAAEDNFIGEAAAIFKDIGSDNATNFLRKFLS
jgi:hypothetical protein